MGITPNDNTGVAIRWLVWLVAAIGIAAGAVTIVDVSLSLQRIEAHRKATEEARREVSVAIERVRDVRSRTAIALQQIMNGVSDTDLLGIEKSSIHDCIANARAQMLSMTEQEGAEIELLWELGEDLDDVVDYLRVCQSIGILFQDLEARRKQAGQRVRTAIAELLMAASKAEGVQRLQLAVQLNRLSKEGPKEGQNPYEQLLSSLRSGQQSSQLYTNLSDAALLVEGMLAEDSTDELRSLKDNRLRQTLARLRRDSLRLPGDASEDYMSRLDEFQQLLFGTESYDDQKHQTMLATGDGLYSLQMNSILTSKSFNRSAINCQELVGKCLASEQAVLQLLADLYATSAEESINRLRTASQSLYTVAGVAFLAFVVAATWIGRLIGKVVRISQERTRESTEMARILNESPNEVYIFSRDTLKFVEVNEGACEASGFSRDELFGMTPLDLSSEYTQEGFAELLAPLNGGEIEVLQYQTDNRRKRGGSYSVAVSLHLAEYRNQPVYVAFLHDLTEIKQLESQLSQAQKLESIGQMAAGIAHEINTPMQFVNGNIEFLNQCSDKLFEVLGKYESLLESDEPHAWEARREEISRIKEECHFEHLLQQVPPAIADSSEGIQRVVSIVRAMKEISHPGGSKTAIVDLNQAIESTVAITRNRWKYDCTVHLELDPNLPGVSCYPAEVNQVLLNLVVNAADAIAESREGNTGPLGEITIRTRTENGEAVVAVEDTGCGMPEEVVSKVFDPFFTTKEVGKGTGQGLSIVHNVIVKMHGGRVEIDTEPGAGTVFTVYLPNDGLDEQADRSEQQLAAV